MLKTEILSSNFYALSSQGSRRKWKNRLTKAVWTCCLTLMIGFTWNYSLTDNYLPKTYELRNFPSYTMVLFRYSKRFDQWLTNWNFHQFFTSLYWNHTKEILLFLLHPRFPLIFLSTDPVLRPSSLLDSRTTQMDNTTETQVLIQWGGSSTKRSLIGRFRLPWGWSLFRRRKDWYDHR